jgi:hypothetical protein
MDIVERPVEPSLSVHVLAILSLHHHVDVAHIVALNLK